MAKFSRDPSTQNGAIIVSPSDSYIAGAANNFPHGVLELPERMVRPKKYLYIGHAEENAIQQAALKGISTEGATMYSPWAACNVCARLIISAGIIRVFAHKEAMEKQHTQWNESIAAAIEMFTEAGVEYTLLSHVFGNLTMRFNTEEWHP